MIHVKKAESYQESTKRCKKYNHMRKATSLREVNLVYKMAFKCLCNCSQLPSIGVYFSFPSKKRLFSAKRLMSIILPHEIKSLILFISP